MQALLERKEAHDAVCEARHADEGLAAEYQAIQSALLAADAGHADARAAAAKRATMARRQRRRQDSRLLRGLLRSTSLALRPPAEGEHPAGPDEVRV